LSYSADTEILTRRGWLTFDQLTPADEVATRSPDGRLEWQRPTAQIAEPCSGNLWYFRSQVFNLLLTADHRVLVQRAPKPDRRVSAVPEIRDAAWLAEVPGRSRNWTIPTVSRWTGSAPEYITVPAAERKPGRHHPAQELRIPSTLWVQFLGWYLSEGFVYSAPNLRNYISISQRKPEHKPEIERMLKALSECVQAPPFLRFNWALQKDDYTFSHGPLAELLRRTCYVPGGVCRAWTKHIPHDVKAYPPPLLEILFGAAMRGDGHVEKLNGLRRYATTSQRLADDMIEILQKKGAQAWYDEADNGPRCRRRFRVTERPGDVGRVPYATAVPYAGLVYNVRVPNGAIYVRREGRTAWCGSAELQ
jgi:replicative DNA helicase Mcm